MRARARPGRSSRGYVEGGGNFIDTAGVYAAGASEELLGTFMKETGTRERLVVATKFTVASTPGDPNSGGNGRKNMLASLEASLRRLQTDYVASWAGPAIRRSPSCSRISVLRTSRLSPPG